MLKFSFWGFAHHGAFLACATATVLACSNDGSGETGKSAGEVCTQGDTRECVGAGACNGGQLCDDDGKWGKCECGIDADETTDGGSASDESTGSTSTDEETSSTGSDATDVDGEGASASGGTDGGDSESDGVGETDSSTSSPPGDTDGAESGAGTDDGAPVGRPDGGSLPAAPAENTPPALPETQDAGELVPDGYALGESLVPTKSLVASDRETYRNEDLDYTWFLRASTSKGKEFDVDDRGAFCLRGEARHFYDYVNGEFPGAEFWFILGRDENGIATRWYDARDKVYGFYFELENTPATGVAVQVATGVPRMLEYSALDWFIGSSHTDGVNVVMFPLEDQAFDWAYLASIRFGVHTRDFAEAEGTPQPYDFCLKALRPIIRVDG